MLSTKLNHIAELARRKPKMVISTLFHHINEEFLREAYRWINKRGVPGVDGVTRENYEQNLTANLKELCRRMQMKQYKAPSVRRVRIPKSDGTTRALGIPTFEDKIAQKAVAMLLEQVYEQDFYPSSYGFRPGKKAHDALNHMWKVIMEGRQYWIIDADIRKCFDTIDHVKMQECLQKRIKDGNVIRYVGKWLNAGILDGSQLIRPDQGTPQGGVISPLLANIYLHEVLDKWFYEDVKPRLKGKSSLVRYADDFVILCENEVDAKRIYNVLPKRFSKYGLTIHSGKTQLHNFRRPGNDNDDTPTFKFLGFCHYWGKSRKGKWVVKRKTEKTRLSQALSRVWEWCRENRHQPIRYQHRLLRAKLLGHYQYYGVRCNSRSLAKLHYQVRRSWHYWLKRRGSNRQPTWEQYEKLLLYFPLPPPRIVHAI